MRRYFYRVFFGVALLLWLILSVYLMWQAERQAITLIDIRFSSFVSFIWIISGLIFVVLVLLAITRSRFNSMQQINRFETVSTYLNDGVIICDTKGKVQWHNSVAQPLIEQGKHINEDVPNLLKEVNSSRRMSMQTVSVSEKQRYNIQVLPLDKQHYALIYHPSQATDSKSNFYENFIRRIVHDMRNPLAAIIGHTSNMSQSPVVEAESWRKSVNIIDDEAKRLTRLVDSLLFDARLAYVPLQPQMLDLADVLEESLFTHDERAARDNKTLELNLPPSEALFEGDRDLLVRAIENLIDNSLKYMADAGKITISLYLEAEHYLIEISDDGDGIPAEYLPTRIFEPLVRARVTGSGSGLGLSIVRKIIEMHRGSITAQSELGRGTSMMIRLPRSHE